MRILFNGLTALKPRTGIGQYCVHLANAAVKLLPGEFDIYPTPFVRTMVSRSMKLAGPKTASQATTPSWKQRVRGQITRTMKNLGQSATGVHFQRHCRASKAELYHEPNFLPFDVDVPTVITVHDLSVLLYPQWHPADRVRQHQQKLKVAIRQAAHVITDTEQVKHEIVEQLGIKATNITAVHLGVGPEFAPASEQDLLQTRKALSLPGRYFLCVGTIEPRKNLLTAMKAFAALPSTTREQCPLLLAGPWGWRADAEREFYERHGKAAGIRHLGYVPDAALPSLFSGAVALLYPSVYEGFGLPPLEAAACGTNIVCSAECAAVREVMGDRATFVNADDVDGWRNAMQSLIERGVLTPCVTLPRGVNTPRSGNQYSWQTTAQQTIAVYEQVLGLTSSLRAAA
ncbi:glycosyltransferase family 1 protein [soil metagenome]